MNSEYILTNFFDGVIVAGIAMVFICVQFFICMIAYGILHKYIDTTNWPAIKEITFYSIAGDIMLFILFGIFFLLGLLY